MKKLNMVIGTFFSEVGLDLLKKFSTFVNNAENLEKKLKILPQWGKKDFKDAKDFLIRDSEYGQKRMLTLTNFALTRYAFSIYY